MYESHYYASRGGPDRRECSCGHTAFLHTDRSGCLSHTCGCKHFDEKGENSKYREAIDKSEAVVV